MRLPCIIPIARLSTLLVLCASTLGTISFNHQPEPCFFCTPCVALDFAAGTFRPLFNMAWCNMYSICPFTLRNSSEAHFSKT